MNNDKRCIFFISVLTLILVFAFPASVYAHEEKTIVEYEKYDTSNYHLHYTDWGIKEEKYGYGSYHSNTPEITFEFDGDFSCVYDRDGNSYDGSYLKNHFREGSLLWNNAQFYDDQSRIKPFKVTEQSNALVKIRAYYNNNESIAGYVDNPNSTTDPKNHYTYTIIWLNIYWLGEDNFEKNKITSAHELGHIFGLVDLDKYNFMNSLPSQFKNVLMGYARNDDVTGPTDADIKGAAVITGIHNNEDHVFGRYGLYHNSNVETDVNDIYHRKICNICDGYILEPHNYQYENMGDYHRKRCSLCSYTVEMENHELSSWTSVSDSLHQSTCTKCGGIVVERHNVGDYQDTNSSIHTAYCTDYCGYSVAAPHSYGAWKNYNESTHSSECVECNRTATQSHTFTNWTSSGSLRHTGSCLGCGAAVTQSHNFNTSYDSTVFCYKKTCIDCGYTESETHSFSSWIDSGSSYHGKTCGNCGHVLKASHSYGDWRDLNSSYHTSACSACGRTQNESHADYYEPRVGCTRCGRTGPITLPQSMPQDLIRRSYIN